MNAPTPDRPAHILLVEDSPSDARLTMEALRRRNLHEHVHHVTTGEDAMDFLYRQGRFSDAPRPDMILLDLNLPGISGLEVLGRVKSDDDLKRISVVVLTVSTDESDMHKAQELSANLYVTKLANVDEFVEAVSQIDRFWSDNVNALS